MTISDNFKEQKKAYFKAKGLEEEDFKIYRISDMGRSEMVKEFFDNPKKKFGEEEIFNKVIANVECVSPTNIYVGGFITLLCYRMIENFDERGFALDFVVALKKVYDTSLDFESPVHARWQASSSNVLFSTLLMKCMKPEAEELALRFLKIKGFMPHNPLTCWNLAMFHYQYAMLLLDKGKEQNAAHHFEECFTVCRNGINEIFHSRNEFFPRMIVDCENMLKLAKNSVFAMSSIWGKKLPEGSRFARFKVTATDRFNGLLPITRFDTKEEDLAWHRSIQTKINTKIKRLS